MEHRLEPPWAGTSSGGGHTGPLRDTVPEKTGIPAFLRDFSFFCAEKEKMEENARSIVITYKIPEKLEKFSNN